MSDKPPLLTLTVNLAAEDARNPRIATAIRGVIAARGAQRGRITTATSAATGAQNERNLSCNSPKSNKA